jgi:hypothetical protein
MQDETCPFRERNRAVWILGRLADERALPALEKNYTGAACDHEHSLCQSELRKAICRCGGSGRSGSQNTKLVMRNAEAKEL